MDPVNQHPDGTWWFWDEVWSEEAGPFPSEESARKGLKSYARSLEAGDDYYDEWPEGAMWESARRVMEEEP